MKEDLLESGNKLKKPLIYGAVGFLIFVIVVIIAAVIQNKSKETNEIIPPVENKAAQQNVSQFKPLDIEEADEKVEEKETKVKKQPPLHSNQSQKQETENTLPKEKEEKIELPKETKQVETKKEEPIETKKEEPKTKKALSKKPTPKIAKEGKYYIQVAALLKNATPNKKFLKLIKKQGFNYKLYHTYLIKDSKKIKVTKILIGPFKSKNEAKKVLPKIKREISQTAFIFKVK